MREVEISTEFIKLGQFLKLAGLVGQGSDVKMLIKDEMVLVNEKVEVQRGKKLYNNDLVELKEEEKVKVISTFKE